MDTGKFIVIDGTDGSGKTTQLKILKEKLISEGFNVEIADFPQYGAKSAGLVEEYLNGKYGNPEEVGPYRASIFYAADRYDASFKIKKWLNEGKIVISNRYVASNMAHQGGKIKDEQERSAYFNWLENLEYEIFTIPRPDLNIILHVDAAVAQKLVDNKESRDYINGKKRDIHEADLSHLRDAEKVYSDIAKTFPGFVFLECTRNGDIMPIDEISSNIWDVIINNIKTMPEKNSNQSYLLVEKTDADSKLPRLAYKGDAGYDIFSNEDVTIVPDDICDIKSGIKVKIPQGSAGLIWDKSGIAKTGIHVLGGVIDSNFRGEIKVIVKNLSNKVLVITKGQKIAQLLIQKVETLTVVEGKITIDNDRGENMYGSSGMF